VLVLDPQLTHLADQQNGLLTHSQLMFAGWSRDTIKFRARAWRRILEGVYLVDGRAAGEDVLGMAALLRWPAAVLSHDTAARRRGWKLLDQQPKWDTWLPDETKADRLVHLTSTRQFRMQDGFRLHRANPGDFSLVGAARVTDELRTLADIARTAPLPVAVCLIDALCHTDLALFDHLHTELVRLSGQRGVLRAQRACRLAQPGSESMLESLLRLLLFLAGLPQPKVQVPVRHAGGMYYGDLGYPDRKLILEADGKDHHSQWAQVMNDMARQNVIVLDGWTVLRFSWRQVLYQPDVLIRTVSRALAVGGVR
jgi:very-short-patch-repair endonuclease